MPFSLPYVAPSVKDVPFSTWTASIVPASGKVIKETVTLRKEPPAGTAPTYMLYDLLLYFVPKPFGPPAAKETAQRKGNVYYDAYLPYEGISLTAHIRAADLPSYKPVSEEYTRSISQLLWDARKDVWTKASVMPRSLAAVVDKCKYAKLLTDVGAPSEQPAEELAPLGFELSIAGCGAAVHKAYMTSRVSPTSRHGERVAYATYSPQPAADAVEEGVTVTKFYLVVPAPPGSKYSHAAISRVPWREDGSLYTSAVKKGKDGEDLWRKIGPQDITPGTTADAMIEDRTLSANKSDASVGKRLTILELYLKRAPARPSTRPPPPKSLSATDVILDEADTYAALEALAYEEMEANVAAELNIGKPAAKDAAEEDDPDAPEELPAPPIAGVKRSRSIAHTFSSKSTAASGGESDEDVVPPAGQVTKK